MKFITQFRLQTRTARFVDITLLLAAVFCLVLAVVKATTTSFTHDESLSYNVYVPFPVGDITGYVNTYGLTNNHILNTLMMKLCDLLFGSSPLSLRLPNLFALVVYMIFGYKLLKKLNVSGLLWGGFILLICNLFLNDFFALARGYGLANALLLVAIWFLFKVQETPAVKSNIAVLFFSGLMIWANFTMLHVAFTIVLIQTYFLYRHYKPRSFPAILKTVQYAFYFTVLMTAILYEPFRTILKWQTTFGGTNSFWADSVTGIVLGSIYNTANMHFANIVLVFVAILLAIVSVIALITVFRSEKSPLPVYLLLLFLPAILFILQHHILGTEFPVNRTVQYFYPLFIFIIVAAVAVFAGKWQKLQYVIVGLGISSAVYFSFNYSGHTYTEWKYDASDREMLADLQQLQEKSKQQPLQLGTNWLCEPGINYERIRTNAAWLKPVTRGNIDSACDYYYVLDFDTAAMKTKGRTLVHAYPQSNTYLYK